MDEDSNGQYVLGPVVRAEQRETCHTQPKTNRSELPTEVTEGFGLLAVLGVSTFRF